MSLPIPKIPGTTGPEQHCLGPWERVIAGCAPSSVHSASCAGNRMKFPMSRNKSDSSGRVPRRLYPGTDAMANQEGGGNHSARTVTRTGREASV
jgi:hypothetical protein